MGQWSVICTIVQLSQRPPRSSKGALFQFPVKNRRPVLSMLVPMIASIELYETLYLFSFVTHQQRFEFLVEQFRIDFKHFDPPPPCC